MATARSVSSGDFGCAISGSAQFKRGGKLWRSLRLEAGHESATVFSAFRNASRWVGHTAAPPFAGALFMAFRNALSSLGLRTYTNLWAPGWVQGSQDEILQAFEEKSQEPITMGSWLRSWPASRRFSRRFETRSGRSGGLPCSETGPVFTAFRNATGQGRMNAATTSEAVPPPFWSAGCRGRAPSLQ